MKQGENKPEKCEMGFLFLRDSLLDRGFRRVCGFSMPSTGRIDEIN